MQQHWLNDTVALTDRANLIFKDDDSAVWDEEEEDDEKESAKIQIYMIRFILPQKLWT